MPATNYDVNSGRSSASVAAAPQQNVAYNPFTVDFDPNKLSKEIAYRAWHQRRALQPTRQSSLLEGGGGAVAAPTSRGAWAAAPKQEAPQQDAFFRKFVNIGNSAGWIPAQAWEPGAVAGGYMPIGQRAPSPSQAAFVDSGPSRASLVEQRAAVQAPSYEERFGINPYATGVLADRQRGLGGYRDYSGGK